MANPILKQKLTQGDFFVVPGAQDMIAAAIIDKVGFDLVYGTGFWLTASASGLPDAGIVGYAEMVDRMRTLVRSSRAAVIADADTGYGGLLNVHHTVRGYEEAGVTAIQIEGSGISEKNAGHTPNKRVIPTEEMARKIEVAAAARQDQENFLIIARTDARATEGLDAALRRLDAYDKAGGRYPLPGSAAERRRDGGGLSCIPEADDGQHGGRRPHADPARRAPRGPRLRLRDLSLDDEPCGGGGHGTRAPHAEDAGHQPERRGSALRFRGILPPYRLRRRLGLRAPLGVTGDARRRRRSAFEGSRACDAGARRTLGPRGRKLTNC